MLFGIKNDRNIIMNLFIAFILRNIDIDLQNTIKHLFSKTTTTIFLNILKKKNIF